MSFAYLLESFPDPSKTFVFREVAEAIEQGLAPAIYSVREPSVAERGMYEGSLLDVQYLPVEADLRADVETQRGSFSSRQRGELSHWRKVKGDSTRVFEALWLGRELRLQGVRHVHAHFAGLAARTAWLLRRLWGISYSFTGHADDIFSPEAHEISLGKLVRDARFIATETDYSRARLEAEFAAARGKTFRVFNGIGEECFEDPRQKITGIAVPLPQTRPRILCVGRMVEKKGYPTLLEAAALLRQRGVGFGMDIIGGGPMEVELRALVEGRGLDSVVTLHGPQPQSFVRARLAEARVFALAAQMEGDGGSDNLPTVIMEAMAAGKPVVSTRLAGIPEMVDDGQTGALVAAGDAPALADRLALYLGNAALAEEHGQRGRECARRKFGIGASVRTLAGLLAHRGAVKFPAEALTRDPTLRISLAERLRCWLRR